MLKLADLKDFTELEIRQHLSSEYAGKDSGFNYGSPTELEKSELLNELDNYSILVAYESVGDYGCDSASWFLLQNVKSGLYFEVSGSHCSCYGFEGQFELCETPLEYLKSDKFYLGCGGYDDEGGENQEQVKAFLKSL